MICKQLNFRNEKEIVSYLNSIEVDPAGINIMKHKISCFNIEIRNIRVPAAIILKQEMLSIGAELSIPKNFIVNTDVSRTGTVLLMCTKKQLDLIIKKIRLQQFGLSELSYKLKEISRVSQLRWKFKDKVLDCSDNQYYIMGIINATPDSFYDGNFEFNIDNLLKKCEKHLNEGADIIDVGGESTRPGSLKITEAEELNRVVPVIKAIKKEFKNIIVSVDSTKFNVVKAALEEGADIINDISGLNFDESLADLAREYYAGLVLMHIQKQPENMQENPNYSNLMNDIIDFLDNSIEKALSNGVNLESVVIDPGIGFGKTVEHNTEIINRLNELKTFNRPILMGVSNKSFIGKILNLNIDERVLPTAVCNSISLTKGSSIFRVHNVLETKLSLKLTKQILDSNIKK